LKQGHLIDLQPNRHGRLHRIADKGDRGQKYPEVRVGAAIMHQLQHINTAFQSAQNQHNQNVHSDADEQQRGRVGGSEELQPMYLMSFPTLLILPEILHQSIRNQRCSTKSAQKQSFDAARRLGRNTCYRWRRRL
jgi:hypothetical protein